MADEDPGLDVDPSLFEDVKYYISGSLDEQVKDFNLWIQVLEKAGYFLAIRWGYMWVINWKVSDETRAKRCLAKCDKSLRQNHLNVIAWSFFLIFLNNQLMNPKKDSASIKIVDHWSQLSLRKEMFEKCNGDKTPSLFWYDLTWLQPINN